MAILDSLFPASYRGVPFLIESSSVKGGRKQVVHEFPNSDKRYVEDLGLENETISIQATVPTSDYFTIRDSLKRAFEQKGYGTLIHPFYGIRQVAVMSYDISESTSSLGYVTISIEMKQAQDLFSSGETNLQSLSILAAALLSVARDSYGNSYKGTNSYSIATVGAIGAATDIINNIFQAGQNFITRKDTDPDDLAVYNSRIDQLRGNYIAYLANPATSTETFFDKTRLVIVALDALATDGRQGVDIAKRLAGVQLSVPVTAAVTAAQKDRVANQNTLLEMQLVFAFAVYCRNISFYRPNNLDEVEDLRNTLTSLYEGLLGATTLSTEVMSQVQTLRAASNAFLETQALVAPQIQMIEVFGIPLTVIEYQLYGNLEDPVDLNGAQDRTETLRLLNRQDNRDPSNLEGVFKAYISEIE